MPPVKQVHESTLDLLKNNLRHFVEISGWLSTNSQFINRIGTGNCDMYYSPTANESTPSCAVYDTGFTDRSSANQSGNWFDLYKIIHGSHHIPQIQKINLESDYLRAAFHIQQDILSQPDAAQRRTQIENRRTLQAPNYQVDIKKILMAHKYWEKSANYLYSRGVTQEQIMRHKIGSMQWTFDVYYGDKCVKVTSQVVSIPNIFRGTARDVELRVDDLSFQKAISNLGKDVIDAIARDNGYNPDYVDVPTLAKAVLPGRFLMYGTTQYLWNTGALFKPDNSRRNLAQCLVTEGRFDGLGLEAAGYPVVQAKRNDILGGNLSNAFKDVSEVVIVEDNDGGAGVARTAWLKSKLGNKPIRVVTPTHPFKDTNDLIQIQATECESNGMYQPHRYQRVSNLMIDNKVYRLKLNDSKWGDWGS
jgi:hypothetical protein